MSALLDRLEIFADRLSKPTAIVGILGLLLIALITIATVIARAVFNYPIVWGHDAASLIVIVLVAACFPAGVMQRKHIAIEFLNPVVGQTGQRILGAMAAVFTAVALTVVAWQVTVVAGEETAARATTIVARIPTGPAWWIAAAVVWAAVPMQIIVTFQAAAGRERPQNKDDHL